MIYLKKIYLTAEDLLSSLSLLLLAFIPVGEVILRKIFHTGIYGSTEYISHLVFILAFLGATITSRHDRHLCFSAAIEYIPLPYKEWIKIVNSFISSLVCVLIAASSVSFINSAFTIYDKIGIIPLKLIMYIMTLSLIIIALRFIFHSLKGIINKLILFGSVAIAAIVLIFYSYIFLKYFYIPSLIIILFLLFLGTPIFIILGALSLIFFGISQGSYEIIPNEAYTLLTGPNIAAIPLFTFAGFILSESKAGDRLVKLFREFFGWLPGGLGITAILICTFFTSITGASGVTVLALGGILLFILMENGYKEKFGIGLVTVSGVGTLFPPSMPLIMYGIIAQINIKHLFIGAFLPGCLMALALSIYVYIIEKKKGIKKIKFNNKNAIASLKESIWEVIFPLVILIVYFGGIGTLVETAAISVFYLLIIEIFVNKDISIRQIPAVCLKSIQITGGILVLLAIAMGFSYYLIDAEIPQNIAAWTKDIIQSKILFLLILNILLIIAASIMDVYGAIIVIAPLIIPLGKAYGIDPIHLGIIFLANLELGYLTPPLGLNLFLSSLRFNKSLLSVSKYIIPFFIVLLISLMIITYFPVFTTGIFNLLNITR